MCELVQAFELDEALSGGTWTVFAPTNDAFAAIADVIATLDPETILDIVLFHAVPEAAVFSTDLVCDGSVTMANGQDSTTICTQDAVFQVGPDNLEDLLPQITAADIEACNGVVHVVDNVLLPEGVLVDPTSPPIDGPIAIVSVNIVFDGFAPEIGWEITDANGAVVESVPIGFYAPLTESATQEVELVAGADYTFTIFDLFGDGMSNPEDGTYRVVQGVTNLVSGGGNFGREESTPFTTQGGP